MRPAPALFLSSCLRLVSTSRASGKSPSGGAPSDLLAHPDGALAAGANDASQQPVGFRLFGVVLDSMVEVLELLVAYPAQRGDEVGELGADVVAVVAPAGDHLEQDADLGVVVVADLRLDGLGAGHGGLAAEHGGAPAEARGEDLPERVEGCRADAVLGEQGVEGLEVAGLLVVHVLHEGPEVGVAGDDGGCLGCVDEGGGELAGLVDAQGRGEKVALLSGQWLELGRGCRGGCLGRRIRG